MKETQFFMADGPTIPEEAITSHTPKPEAETKDAPTGRVNRRLTHLHGQEVRQKLPGQNIIDQIMAASTGIAEDEEAQKAMRGTSAEREWLAQTASTSLGADILAQIAGSIAAKNNLPFENQNLEGQDTILASPKRAETDNGKVLSVVSEEDKTEEKGEVVASKLSAESITILKNAREEGSYTIDQQIELQSILTTGKFGPFKVIEAFIRNGELNLKLYNEEEQRDFNIRYGAKDREFQALYGVTDPAPAEVTSENNFRSYVETQIAYWEGYYANTGDPIESQTYQALKQTFVTHIKRVPTADATAFTNEILLRLDARVRYHNADISAKFDAAKFADNFSRVTPDMHKEILVNTPGVTEGVNQLITSNGDFYRLDTTRPMIGGIMQQSPADLRVDQIKTNIATSMGLASLGVSTATATEPAMLIFDPEVNRAFELAKKTLNIFGVSADYEGFVDTTGTPYYNFPTPEANADFMMNNLDNINADASQGRGNSAGQMLKLMYLPVWLRQTRNTKDAGANRSLHRFCSLFITSAQKYDDIRSGTVVHPSLPDVPTLLAQAQLNRSDERKRLTDWAASISSAAEGYKQFAEKGGESILNNPLPNANAVRSEGQSKIREALANFDKLSGTAYSHISGDRKQIAMRNWLGGLFEWVNDPDTHRRTNVLGWNKFIEQTVIVWARDSLRINDTSKEILFDRLRINPAVEPLLWDVIPEGIKGGWSVIKWFYQQIYRFKG